MKQTVKFFVFAAAAAAALVSCSKELERVEIPADGINVTLTAGIGTKTVLDGMTPKWNDGDAIGVSDAVSSNVSFAENNIAAGASAATATFAGTVASTGTYYAYYPYSELGVDANGAKVALPAVQNPTVDSFDGNADLLVAKSFEVASTDDTESALEFRRLSAVVKVVIKDGSSKLAGQHLRSLSLTGPANLAGNVYIDLKNQKLGDFAGSESKTVTANYTDKTWFEIDGTNAAYLVVAPQTLANGASLTVTVKGDTRKATKAITLTEDIELKAGRITTLNVSLADSNVSDMAVTLKTVWLKQSAATAWNTYYGGTAGTDRNIAMDDEYVYIAESAATPKMWAISIADASDVKAVNVEGVAEGGAHTLTCPRVIKNTDPAVNGGKDVLVCCSLTRGGVDPKLYIWNNGIENAPKAVTLTTWATDAWYGDTFTVFGTLQDCILFFDKTGSSKDDNGVVTFRMQGVPAGSQLFLRARLKFNDAMGSHSGICAYYPYPDNINTGVYSPGRGVEKRGKNVVATGDIWGEGGVTTELTDLDYDEGTNGYVLGYNYVEWNGKRYVIYGNQPSSSTGYIRVREGASTDAWATIASTGSRISRRDLVVASGSLKSGNSGMDIAARVINGDLYFVGQKQNVACGLYKLCYE